MLLFLYVAIADESPFSNGNFSIKYFYIESVWFHFETSAANDGKILFFFALHVLPKELCVLLSWIAAYTHHPSRPNNIFITSSYRETNKSTVNQRTKKIHKPATMHSCVLFIPPMFKLKWQDYCLFMLRIYSTAF